MGKEKFKNGLLEMGLEVEDRDGPWLTVRSYPVEVGRFAGQTISLGFEVPGDFEITAPHGPHISPLLLPINTGSTEHSERIHPSPLGDDWRHLSRPFPNWEKTKRTVREYMRYVKYLLETL